MKPNPRNILKLSDKRYDAKEPHKNRRLDVVYSLFKRRDPLPAQTEMAFFTDTSICSGCKSCEIACKQWNMLQDHRYPMVGEQLRQYPRSFFRELAARQVHRALLRGQ